MTNPRGTQLETAARNWLREHGWPFARRVVKEGALDKGDLTLGDGIPVTIECKNEKKINLAGGANELRDEMANNGHKWGFTIHKKRGTTDVGKYYAVLPVEVLVDILDVALEAGRRRQPVRKTPALEPVVPVARKRVIARISTD